jgi:type II secretory ATPase GspE/PulE/Tfp pilus assembly ATPase PilB-like protein
MFLVTGRTGSGKTTTLYAILQELKLADRSIVTIEDPVEYQVDGITQMEVDHYHGLNYAEGLKSSLRMDPDYLMVGEVRDAESARASTDASITGRVLQSTMHSRDAAGAESSLRSWAILHHEIFTSLRVVIAQRLVRKLCPECRKQGEVSTRVRRWMEGMSLPAPETAWQPVGCTTCQGLGFRGRTGVFEVWTLDEDDYDLISAHAEERKIRQRLTEKEHLTLLADGLSKAAEGVTTLEELISMGGYDPRFPQVFAKSALEAKAS